MKKRIINKGLFIFVIIVLLLGCKSEAKTVYRYATKTMSVKELPKKKSKTVLKLNRNNKVILLKKGKTWSKIQFNEQKGYCKTKALNTKRSPKKYGKRYFKHRGVIRWGGAKWTWYTQRRLPGRGLKIPGRHVDKNGFVCDKDDYIVLASSIGYKKQHKILPTPFGKYGKVYDTNGTWNYGWRDVYTNW